MLILVVWLHKNFKKRRACCLVNVGWLENSTSMALTMPKFQDVVSSCFNLFPVIGAIVAYSFFALFFVMSSSSSVSLLETTVKHNSEMGSIVCDSL